MAQPSAEQAIWSHLPSGEVERSEEVRGPASPLAQAMYPRPKANPYRESLLRGLREWNGRRREGRR
jgi:hypothetical protein